MISILCVSAVEAKPLKVFILAGQSNMEGHAKVETFPAIAKDPKTASLHKDMVGADGKPVVCENVWIAYSYGAGGGKPGGTKSGKLTAGWGAQANPNFTKIGPEFTFGIYMNKMLGEPILLIKTAWGGKSLYNDYRPPSAGPNNLVPSEKMTDELKKATGFNYKLMMDYVKEVLADPKTVYPAYDPKEGYELAGFVWFQGFNDMVGPYPKANPDDKKSKLKDFSEYSRLLELFIQDVRKDLSAPKLPFVIGVLGTGGKNTESESNIAFRKAMAAPAGMDEFKGNVVNVFTANYWPPELDPVQVKVRKIENEIKRKYRTPKDQKLSREKRNAIQVQKRAEQETKIKAALTEQEVFLWKHGISNSGYHYNGSAKFFGLVGKAFAEALIEMEK